MSSGTARVTVPSAAIGQPADLRNEPMAAVMLPPFSHANSLSVSGQPGIERQCFKMNAVSINSASHMAGSWNSVNGNLRAPVLVLVLPLIVVAHAPSASGSPEPDHHSALPPVELG